MASTQWSMVSDARGGIGSSVDDQVQFTKRLIGTEAWMAPEIQTRAHAVTTKADVYSCTF